MPEVWVAGERDAAHVSALMAGFRDHMGRSEPPTAQLQTTVDALLRDPATEFLLATADGRSEPAGVCQLRYRLAVWTGTDDCWLEDLFVRDDARRSGLGRALVTAALERAVARGCGRIQLDVDDDNHSAIALYEAMGFSLSAKPPGRNYLMGRRLP